MCGICGIVNFNKASPSKENLRPMMEAIKHRGPDDEGVFIEDSVGFGFVRLSIIDISIKGHQPFFDSTGRYVMIYNGEVYNYIEIREVLKKRGYTFTSNSDTEVVLNSFIEWGKECMQKFNGMWAFAIYDRIDKVVFISRDRFGVKPFYYYSNSEFFAFSSEIPSLLKVIKNKPKANSLQIFDYMVFNRTDNTEDTFFENIVKLPHGHSITINLSNNSPVLHKSKWYDLANAVSVAKPFNDPAEYYNIFSSSLGLRLRSDVPIGVCLSGGLDSSSIISTLLKEFNTFDINTFSATYGIAQHGDESRYINEYSHLLKNMWRTTPDAATLFTDFKDFIIAHAEPIPSTSPYAQFKVMELAKKHVVVTLDGQGADEQLAGYPYFYGFYYKELLLRLKLLLLSKELIYYLYHHKSTEGIKAMIYFLLPASKRTDLKIASKSFFSSTFISQNSSSSKVSETLYGSKTLKESLLNHFEYKLEHLLKWEDRNSMFHSIEARVPFLDYRLVERSLASANKMIIFNGQNKYILRQAMKHTLPEKIRSRQDKIGFSTPQKEWFKSDNLRGIVDEILESSSFRNREFIDAKRAREAFKIHLAGKVDISNEVWKWINLEYWFRYFID